MARPLIAGLAPGIVLTEDYIVSIVALDPTTGAPVSGVAVSGVSMQVDSLEPDDQGQPVAPLPPLFSEVPTG